MEGLAKTHELLQKNLMEAQRRQSKYVGGKQITFEVRDLVWLSTQHMKTTRPAKKLDYMRVGHYRVSKVVNCTAYKLDLPKPIRRHNVFHVSLLDPYTTPGTRAASARA